MKQVHAFDPVSEEKYAAGHVERYPWDAVVSFVFRHAPRDRSRGEVGVMEVGFGTGSNLWFAAREGFSVAGIEGSRIAAETARARFVEDGLFGDLRVGDFTSLPFESGRFDLAIDRGALCCVGQSRAVLALSEIRRVLRPGGKLLMQLYSDLHSSAISGQPAGDGLVRDIADGSLTGVGQLCFYGRQELALLLADFTVLSMQHVVLTEELQARKSQHCEWRVLAQKP